MSEEPLIKVEGVRKKFCRSLKKSLWYGMKDIGAEILGGSRDHNQLRPQEFWAVKNVSFAVKRGECLGLIGQNGAGKSTLLRMLAGLIKLDAGRIEMRGTVGSLIALGTGFNPILTGRENIYVSGSVLGLTKKEIDEKIEEIIDFSEIRDFIDSPVQSYSSGMQVRLGFAVATTLEPDVLLLDEVLAVGDLAFRTKCLIRISSLLRDAAVIFVSHSEEFLMRICTQGIVLREGESVYAGSIKDCLNTYRETQMDSRNLLVSYHGAGIKEAELILPGGHRHRSGDDLRFEIHYEVDREIQLSMHMLAVLDPSGIDVASCDLRGLSSRIPKGRSILKGFIQALALRPGIYYLGIEALSTQQASTVVKKRFSTFTLNVQESIIHWSSYTPRALPIEG